MTDDLPASESHAASTGTQPAAKTTVSVDFHIYGDQLDTKVVTKELGMIPTESWMKGDLVTGKHVRQGARRRFSQWKISTGYEASDDINIQLTKIFDLLKDKVNKLVELKRQYGLEYRIDVVPHVENGDVPLMSFHEWIIDFAHAIRARIWIDLYIMS